MTMFAELDTPSVLVDLERLENNIARMAKLTQEAGVQLRPMIKTHKSPEIAKMQLEAGAIGVLAAKLGEAEVMGRAGISDILVTYNIVGPTKVKRLRELARRTNIMVTVDSAEVAEGISQQAAHEGCSIRALVERGDYPERLW